MKLPFLIYLFALGFYVLLTAPALAMPVIYITSMFFAVAAGFIAVAIFALVFFILHISRAPYTIAVAVLAFAVVLSVAAAFAMLFGNGSDVWFIGGNMFILFPVAAVVAGWLSICVNSRKIKNHFSPSLQNDIETIGINHQNQII
jgi:hypothetical protein